MKKIFAALVLLSAFACNSQAPETESAATTETAAVVDSTKGVLNFAGPDVDLLKKAANAYAAGDWATWRSCFSDSAVAIHNGNAGDPGIKIDSLAAIHKNNREKVWEGMTMDNTIYETVTTASGDTYGHLWAQLTTKNRKTGKTVKLPVFASYLIKDGKLQWEWAIYDSKKLE